MRIPPSCHQKQDGGICLIAKNMLAMGLSAEQVAKATQLPLDIIKNQNNS